MSPPAARRRCSGPSEETLPSFPLPQFAGLDLSLVEIGRAGSGFVLFADLVPAA